MFPKVIPFNRESVIVQFNAHLLLPTYCQPQDFARQYFYCQWTRTREKKRKKNIFFLTNQYISKKFNLLRITIRGLIIK